MEHFFLSFSSFIFPISKFPSPFFIDQRSSINPIYNRLVHLLPVSLHKSLYSGIKRPTVLPRLSCLLFFLLFILGYKPLQAQESTIESIPLQSVPEVYDLLKDSKGYLWLAHDLGVSRYDGSSFIHLNNPQQNSLAMTDLAEDKQGRIWCHNFTGQIFYIENLKIHLLEKYKYEEEDWYPRTVICGNELIATSIKGFFVYNILTAKATYHSIPGGTRSLVKVGNKVIFYGKSGWHYYESGRPIRKLFSDLSFPENQAVSLQNESLRDTFYLTVNPMSSFYKLTLNGNVIKVQEEIKTTAFINTISVDGSSVWVNTKDHSFTTSGEDSIQGWNLSDVITDNNGHRWMSSLKKGLCVQYNTQKINKLDLSVLSKGDYVRGMHAEGNHVFLTTGNGKLYELNKQSALTYILSIPKQAGIIEHIASFGPDQFLIAASVGVYLYNTKTQQLDLVEQSFNIKDIAVHQGKGYLATAIGVYLIQRLPSKPVPIMSGDLFFKENRCKSLAFAGDSLIIAYSDGVYIEYKDKLRPLLYKQRPIYASKIKVVNDKILIGTYNQGLLIVENGTVRNLTAQDGLVSNIIKDIKVSAGKVWLAYYDDFQQLNATLTGIEDVDFYLPKAAGINDFDVLNNKLYVAVTEDVYSMGVTASASNFSVATYIDKVIANGSELMAATELKHYQNHLQFHVSTPFYSPHSKIIYQYRIKSANDSAWRIGAHGQSVFNVVALEPGEYTFEVVATDKSKKAISLPAVYQFEIAPPWQQTWTFRIVAGIAIAALGLYVVRQYYSSRLRKQRIDYEKKLAVQEERQRISAEIHDDIGAGLSAIRLLTEMTKNKLPETEVQQEVGKIHTSVSELSLKMREVIWSLSTDNDHLESLLYYLQRQAMKLFENSPIQLRVSFPEQEIPNMVINGEKRRHIYLAVKEALHNSLKHSEAQTCHLSMQVEGNILQITITDDGKGFVPVEKAQAGNGLRNMNRRMQQIHGHFTLHSNTKTEVRFRIPLNEKS